MLNAASQLADQQQDQPAGLDHLLLVLAREQRSVVSRILRDCGLDEIALAGALGQLPLASNLTSEALLEDVIDHAVDRADQLGTHYTGTDHILLALAQNPQGAKLLQRYGVSLDRLLTAIYRDLLPPS